MRRRVVLLTPGHREPGGAQRRSRLIAEQLAEQGWETCVVTRAGTLTWPRFERTGRLAVAEIPGFGHRRVGAVLYLLAAIPLALIWGVRARAFVSVQLMSTTTVAGVCGLILRRPFMAMATTTGGLSEVSYLRSTRLWPLRRRLLGRARFLFAQTPGSVHTLTELVAEERIEVLPNPVRVPDAAPRLTGEPRVLFAGRLSAEKNLGALLDAWERLVGENPEARLTLAGVGGEYRSVESELRERVHATAALRDTVEFSGWIEDMSGALASHDVFVLPSLEEGMSNALLEACAAGRVVVASDIASNRAVVGDDYPLLFSPAKPELLARSLEGALGEVDLRERARTAVSRRAELFSTASVIAKLEGFIDAASRARHQHA